MSENKCPLCGSEPQYAAIIEGTAWSLRLPADVQMCGKCMLPRQVWPRIAEMLAENERLRDELELIGGIDIEAVARRCADEDPTHFIDAKELARQLADESLVAENERLRADTPYAAFGRKAFKVTKNAIREGCFDCDAEVLAEAAVECGLMEYVAFDPAKHDREFLDHEFEPGDMIYYWGGGEP